MEETWENLPDPRIEVCWTCGFRLEYFGNHDLECPKCVMADIKIEGRND